MKVEWIKDFKDGEHVHDEFIVASVNKCTSDKGKPYLNILLQDKTGTINAKKWEVSDNDLKLIVPGKILEVEGEINSFKGALQFKILNVQDTIDELVKSAGNDSLIQIKDNELAYGPLIVDKKTFLSLMENDKRLKNRYGLNFHLFDFELKSNSINLPDFLNVLSLTLRRSDVICTDKNHVYSLSVLKKNDDIQVVYNRILVGMSLRFDKKDFEITYNCQSL